MPSVLDDISLNSNVHQAQSLANLQHAPTPTAKPVTQFCLQQDPAVSKISPKDLAVLKDRCPHLAEFSDDFLQQRTIDELLRIESTSLRIKDAERARETEDRLSSNKAAIQRSFLK
jgi:hypothetical protein